MQYQKSNRLHQPKGFLVTINIMIETKRLNYHNLTFNYSFNNNDPSGEGCITEIITKDEYQLYKYTNIKGVILDIGANNGLVTTILALQNPDAFIYSLEPFKKLIQIIEKNINDNNISNVTVINKALGNGEIAELYTGSYCTGASSTNVTDPGEFKRLANASMTKQKIETITFDSLLDTHNIKTIDLLKIDCEGGEYYLIESIKIKNSIIDHLIGEFHNLKYNKFENPNYNSAYLTSYLKNYVHNNFKVTYLDL
jgi:FkbM family methyltransferase